MTDIFPSYIPEPIGLPMLGKPYQFQPAKMGVFLLECETKQLTALLEKYLNKPSNHAVSYQPVVREGKALAVMIMAEMTVNATNTAGKVYGRETYNELSFWVPAIDVHNVKGGVFLPFLFPDQESPIATGREAFGFFKQLGRYRFPRQRWNPAWPEMAMDTVAFDPLGPDTEAKLQQLLSLKVTLGDAKEVAKIGAGWACVDDVKAGVRQVLGALSLGADAALPAALIPGEIDIANLLLDLAPAVFLKQFPAISDTAQASVQCVTEAHFTLSKIRAGLPYLPKSVQLTINTLASHPLVSILGLRANQLLVDGFWLDIDFELQEGRVLGRPAKKKIAVLGGGLGAMSTAFALTSKPGWDALYDVTVHTIGWRLGGKAASGRNRDIYDRIEEHGLHIFFGYYENAFQVMQQLYKELNRPANAPLATWDQAFKKHNTIPIQEYVKGLDDEKSWRTWTLSFPPNDETPGQGAEKPHYAWEFIRLFLGWAKSNIEQLEGPNSVAEDSEPNLFRRIFDHLKNDHPSKLDLTAVIKQAHEIFTEVDDNIQQELALGQKIETQGLDILENLERSERAFAGVIGKCLPKLASIRSLFDRFKTMALQQLEPFLETVDATRRIFLLLALGGVIIRGILDDNVISEGYSAINHIDFRDWLKKHGAREWIYNSALINAFYDLYLCFPNGDTKPPAEGPAVGGSVSAGVMLHAYVLTVGCYKGAVFWKMQAGMGDVIMAPFYEVLKKRGVKFEFFNKVTDIRLSSDGAHVDAIDIDVQATVKPGLSDYNPLYNVKGLPCWPAAPLFEQLVEGQELHAKNIDLESYWADWQPVAKKTLKKGIDFDIAVLGISIGAFPYITKDLIAKNTAWKNMVTNIATTQTQAMQLWLTYNLEETGWPYPNAVMDAYADPFNTWAVMDQLLIRETWPWQADPIAVFYLMNNLQDTQPMPPFDDYAFPAQQKLRVKNNAIEWLKKYSKHLWPYATQADSTALNWDVLNDPENRTGVDRMEAQFFIASINPSDRYVLNAANTNQYRLPAAGSTFGVNNLYLTGDWADNGFQNIGCVESTVMCGLLCARAISGYPEKIIYESPLGAYQKKPENV